MSNLYSLLVDAGVHAVFESGVYNDTFAFVKPTDFVIRCLSSNENVVIGNGSPHASASPYDANAGLYVSDNRVGIRKIPTTDACLDVKGGAIACENDGLVLYASSNENDVSNRVGNCLSASHSNVMLTSNSVINSYMDANGSWQSISGEFGDIMVPLFSDVPVSVKGLDLKDGIDGLREMVLHIASDYSPDVSLFDIDCSRVGNIYKIGRTHYICSASSKVDASSISSSSNIVSMRLKNVIGHGDDVRVDPVLSAMTGGGGGSGAASSIKVNLSRFRKIHSGVQDTAGASSPVHSYEEEGCEAGSLSLEPYRIFPRAVDSEIRLEDGKIVLTCNDDNLWKMRLLRGTLVAVGHKYGLYYVSDASVKMQGSSSFELKLFPVDGRTESTTISAKNRFSDAIAASDEENMPRLYPCANTPSPADIVLTQTNTTFSEGSRCFFMRNDVFGEPLSRILNDITEVANSGNPVRCIRFASDPTRTSIPVVSCFVNEDDLICIQTNGEGSAKFVALGLNLSGMTSVDVTCALTGFPFSLTGSSISSDARYITLRGPQFPRQDTKEAIVRAIKDDSRERSRGDMQLVVSDGVRTIQWIVCDVNDTANRIVLRKRDGTSVSHNDLSPSPNRIIYMIPVSIPRPTTISSEKQPDALVVHSSMCVGGFDKWSEKTVRHIPSMSPVRKREGDAFNLFGNMFMDGNLYLADNGSDKEWTIGATSTGGLLFGFTGDDASYNHSPPPPCHTTAMYISPGPETNLMVSGGLHARGDVLAARFKQASDARLKTNVRDIRDGRNTSRSLLHDFSSEDLSIKRYTMLGDVPWQRDHEEDRVGVIAQDVERMFPESVSYTEAMVPMRRRIRFSLISSQSQSSKSKKCVSIRDYVWRSTYDDDGTDAANDINVGDYFEVFITDRCSYHMQSPSSADIDRGETMGLRVLDKRPEYVVDTPIITPRSHFVMVCSISRSFMTNEIDEKCSRDDMLNLDYLTISRRVSDVRTVSQDVLLYYTMATLQDLLRELGYDKKEKKHPTPGRCYTQCIEK